MEVLDSEPGQRTFPYPNEPFDRKILPWYVPKLPEDHLSPSAKELLRNYSGIEEAKIADHVQQMVCRILFFII